MIHNYGVQVFIAISLQVNRVFCLPLVIADGAAVPAYPLNSFLLSSKVQKAVQLIAINYTVFSSKYMNACLNTLEGERVFLRIFDIQKNRESNLFMHMMTKTVNLLSTARDAELCEKSLCVLFCFVHFPAV